MTDKLNFAELNHISRLLGRDRYRVDQQLAVASTKTEQRYCNTQIAKIKSASAKIEGLISEGSKRNEIGFTEEDIVNG